MTKELIESHKHLFGSHTYREAWIESEITLTNKELKK